MNPTKKMKKYIVGIAAFMILIPAIQPTTVENATTNGLNFQSADYEDTSKGSNEERKRTLEEDLRSKLN